MIVLLNDLRVAKFHDPDLARDYAADLAQQASWHYVRLSSRLKAQGQALSLRDGTSTVEIISTWRIQLKGDNT